MSQPVIHFAHANGFPTGTYACLLEPLRSQFRIIGRPCFAHHPAYPVDHNWQSLVDELLASIEQQASQSPVIGLGHSLGGVLTYMAALKRPDLFTRIILLDPPLLTGLDSLGLKLAKRFGWIDRVTPAGITRGRRNHWPDRQAAVADFQSKKLFRNFDPRALEDYVTHGTTPDPQGGLRLAFDPGIEVAIFRNLADNLSGSHRRLQRRVDLIRGTQSDLITVARMKKFEQMGFICHQVPGGHMFPLENPHATRQCLMQLLSGDLLTDKT